MEESLHEKFNKFFATQLNEQQQKAVLPKIGFFLVRAGAGSGKTRVITARIINLMIREQIEPTAILALTFTNKAAREMKERIKHFLPQYQKLPYIGTFHSYCLAFLKIHKTFLKTPEFTILDSSDQEKLVKSIISQHNLSKKLTARSLCSQISQLKNTYPGNTEHAADSLVNEIYYAYEQEKQKSHCLDFDDLLLETVKLFQTKPLVKERFQTNVQHILVDEYQDTNNVQRVLLQEMALEDKQRKIVSLCAVGDEDQSIYSWRGAITENIINFAQHFSETIEITIDQNYRSVAPILAAANAIISHNKHRAPKNLWSLRTGNDRIRLVTCASHYQEGVIIASLCKRQKQLRSLAETAVLYRSHYQSRAIEEALIRYSIPYKIIGGTQFYDRQEIKDILAYLRLALNPFDRMSLIRAINTPTRSLGDKFLELLFSIWDPQPFLDFKAISKQCIESAHVTGQKRKSLEQFLDIFAQVHTSTMTAHQIATHIIKQTDYIAYLQNAEEPEEAKNRIENVNELLGAIKMLEEKGVKSLADFLDEVALLQDLQNDTHAGEQQYVSLMTLHTSKGLEFGTVVLAGLEEGVFPSPQSLYQPELLEEERRLLYVGFTRTMEHLLITHCKYRVIFGSMNEQKPSRFITEFPKNLFQHHDCSQWSNESCEQYLSTWLANVQHGLSAPATAEIAVLNKPKGNLSIQKIAPSGTNSVITGWKKFQPVYHATFGTGIIHDIEEKYGQEVRLIIQFSEGNPKKISAQFVKAA